MTVQEIIDLAKGHANVASTVTNHDTYLLNVFNTDIYVQTRNEIVRLKLGYFGQDYTQNITANTVVYDIKNQGGSVVDWKQILAVKVKEDASAQNWVPIGYYQGNIDEFEQTEASGYTVPGSYHILGTQITFDIIPSETIANGLKITAVPKNTTAYAVGNTPDIPLDYHWILAWGVASRLAERTGDTDRADRAETKFARGLGKMALELPQRSTQPKTIESAPFSDMG